MNNERYTQILASAFIAVILFTVGFYAGRKDSSNNVPLGLLNATSTSSANMGAFWKAWSVLDEKFVGASSTSPKVADQTKIWGAIEGLTDSYGDPYTVFFPPVESKSFEEEISGSFGGVGMEIGVTDGLLTVIAPLKGTPAVVTFERKGVKEPIVKTLIRAKIEIPTVSTKLLAENVFVISLYNFSATSPNLFRGALREFIKSGSDKLVLDLRNNPGGYLEAALDMASWFLPTGKTVVSEDFGDKAEPKIYRSKGYDIFTDKLKFVILVNEGSASASEILAGALREYNKAILMGTKTFGKGSVQELVDITDETSLKVTVAHWLTPNGNSISNGGLAPDIDVQLTPENTKNGNDPQLNEAVKYLLSK